VALLPHRVGPATLDYPEHQILPSAGVLLLGLEKDLSTTLRDPERVAAVRRTGLLDAAPDPAFDRLARLAGRLLHCPAGMVCLATDEHLYFASAEGAPGVIPATRQAPVESWFCGYVLARRAPFTVEDARQDPALRADAAVTGNGVLAYAGVPLLAPGGQALGALCVVDTQPRHWTRTELADLNDLAAIATAELHRRLQQAVDPAAAAVSAAVRLSYDAIPIIIWTATPEGTCDYVNARWLEFTGRTLAAEVGLGWTEIVHPEDREAYNERFQRALAKREPLQVEYRARRQDDRYRWLHDFAVPRFGPDGEFLGMIGCTTDVTDRRTLEQRLVRAERAQAIGQLAGGIAHDFNNLLTGVIGHVALLQEETGLTELGREDLAQIQRSADRAATLTRQLLAFSRRQVLAPRLLDLNHLVAGCLTTLRRLVGDRVQVVSTPAASLDPVVADPNQLEQVLTQLCANARESMPHGGTLEIVTRQERLDAAAVARLHGLHPGVYVLLQVRDTGRGMDAPTVERIFEPFFTTKAPSEGAGLGLASVYGIVKQSGGHIEVASTPGQGSTFTIYLPRHEGSGPVNVGAGAREPVGGTETILLVEDEQQVRELARRVLERVGYTVLATADAESAVALADRHGGHIHLLVTDMLLPQLGGRELAARLSIHRPAIKVIYISGTNDGSIARLRMIEPAVEFLEKPFSLDRLLRTVRQALGHPDTAGRPG
jgi:PAS domain S-box-containing protein